MFFIIFFYLLFFLLFIFYFYLFYCFFIKLVRVHESGSYHLRSSNKSLILQAPKAITKKSLGDRAGCVQHPKFETIGSLKSTTPTSTKTSPQNITLHYRKFLAVWPSRSRLTMWPKYPKNKLVRAVSEQK